MRIYFPGAARPAWYDRNAAVDSLIFSAVSIAPHANTSRAAFTVPTNRKALVASWFSELMVVTAPSVGGSKISQVVITPDGGSTQNLAFTRLYDIHVVVGTPRAQANSGQIALLQGDVLEIFTSDGGTGGTVAYNTGVAFNEFDA